jgi:hypothetical protein
MSRVVIGHGVIARTAVSFAVGTVWRGIVAALVLLLCVSCSGDPRAVATGWMKVWRAKDFFVDPLQVRLADAVARGDAAEIAAAVRDGADVNAKGKEGIPLLMWAMAKDSVPGFEALLVHGADLKVLANDPQHTRRGERTRTVIEYAVSATNAAYARAAIKSGFDPNYVPFAKTNESLLFRAVWTHAMENAAILLDAGANIDHRDAGEGSAVHLAQSINYFEMIDFLLRRGADPHIKDKWGNDLIAKIKQYHGIGGSVMANPDYAKVIAELKKRGLLTDEDLAEALKRHDRNRAGGRKPGITVIEHAPDSDAGRAIRGLDRREHEAADRDRP